MKFEIKPFSANGKLQAHDIFIDDEWIGSRRTIPQCAEAIVAHAVHANKGILADLKEGSQHRGTIEVDILVRR